MFGRNASPPSEETLLNLYREDPDSPRFYADILKRIFLNSANGEKKVFLVTSALDQEGKTITAMNIATVLAKKGKKTLLVDANFRHPMIGKCFAIDESRGLADILAENLKTEDLIIQDKKLRSLYLLPAGASGSDSLEMFPSTKLGSLLEGVKTSFDFVIIDGSSVNGDLDPLIIGKLVDGIILVVLFDRTQKRHVLVARDKIGKYKGDITGVVLNRIPRYVPPYMT
jgi:capsular exopolysaccharide synthesis family protein